MKYFADFAEFFSLYCSAQYLIYSMIKFSDKTKSLNYYVNAYGVMGIWVGIHIVLSWEEISVLAPIGVPPDYLVC